MKDLVLIVGGGEAGSRLGADLAARNREAAVVEARPEVVEELREELRATLVVAGDGTDPDVLERAGIRRAEVVAAVTGSDATNLAVAHLARFHFGVERVLARVNAPRDAWLFVPELGVDVAVDQTSVMADLLVGEMTLGEVVAMLKLRLGRFALVEAEIPRGAPADGRPVRDLALPEECTLLAVIRLGELVVPRGPTVLRAGDQVLALVPEQARGALSQGLTGG